MGLGLELPWEGVSRLALQVGRPSKPAVVREAQASADCRAASLRLMAGAPQWLPEAKRSSVAGSFPMTGCWWLGRQRPLLFRGPHFPICKTLGHPQSLPARVPLLGCVSCGEAQGPGHAWPHLSRGRWFAHGCLLFSLSTQTMVYVDP